MSEIFTVIKSSQGWTVTPAGTDLVNLANIEKLTQLREELADANAEIKRMRLEIIRLQVANSNL